MNRLLDDLRRLSPNRPLSLNEAYSVAERQTTAFLRRMGISEAPVPTDAITGLPFLKVAVRVPLQAPAASKWVKPRWVVLLNGTDSPQRQRFSLGHELKHIIDHEYVTIAYGQSWRSWTRGDVERLCHYFSACLLMPRPWVKAAYGGGVQDIARLASLFDVSLDAMEIRLLQLGLIEPFAARRGIDNVYYRSAPALPLGRAA